MTDIEFRNLCIEKVRNYYQDHMDVTDLIHDLPEGAVFVVWQVKVLQNSKALLSTTLPDGMYYEITYNGDKDELYFDAYKKWENIKYSGIHAVDPERQ